MFKADLHCHTTCSDGSLTPRALIDLAKSIGLSALSITDHDTIDAYPIALPYAKEMGLLLGTGIEFSCLLDKASVHILGYDFDLGLEAIPDHCAKHRLRRHARNKIILGKLRRLRMAIPENELEELEASGITVGRPHIAQLMVKYGYVASAAVAFQLYLGDKKPAYDPGEGFTVEETIEVIHAAKGKAFLAHPHFYEKQAFIRKLLEMPFDGIECYYGRCLPEQEKPWLEIAAKKGWLVSGGSDFHGEAKPNVELGSSWVIEELFRKIFTRLISS